MVKITINQLKDYFNKNEYSDYATVAKEFNICEELIRKKFKNEVISSLNCKSKYIILKEKHSFDSNGLVKIGNIVFSKYGNIKLTAINIIKSNDLISSDKLYDLLGSTIRQQISKLIKSNKIFLKKNGKHNLYSVNPFEDKIIIKEEFDITSLKKDDKLLRDIEIIKEIKENKKIDVARKYNIDPKTVSDIEKRFEKEGAKGLVHTRSPKIISLHSSVQAAVITEAITNPEKSSEEIKKDMDFSKKISLKEVNKIVTDIREAARLKKNILLKIK